MSFQSTASRSRDVELAKQEIKLNACIAGSYSAGLPTAPVLAFCGLAEDLLVRSNAAVIDCYALAFTCELPDRLRNTPGTIINQQSRVSEG